MEKSNLTASVFMAMGFNAEVVGHCQHRLPEGLGLCDEVRESTHQVAVAGAECGGVVMDRDKRPQSCACGHHTVALCLRAGTSA